MKTRKSKIVGALVGNHYRVTFKPQSIIPDPGLPWQHGRHTARPAIVTSA